MNKKEKKHFNVADIVLIVFSVSVVTLLAFYLFAGNTDYDFSQKKTIYLQIAVEKTDNKNIAEISKGDTIYNSKTGEIIGIAEEINVVRSNEYLTDKENGWQKIVYYPDLSDIYVIIKAEVTERSLDTYKTGQEINACVPSFAFKAKIHGITDHPTPISENFSGKSNTDDSVNSLSGNSADTEESEATT